MPDLYGVLITAGVLAIQYFFQLGIVVFGGRLYQ